MLARLRLDEASEGGSGACVATLGGLSLRFTFTDRGDVWTNQQAGNQSGNEVFPMAALEQGGTWYIYFTGKWELMLAQGPGKASITSDETLLPRPGEYSQAGMIIDKNANEFILPLLVDRTFPGGWFTEMRVVNRATLNVIPAATETYQFNFPDEFTHSFVYLDRTAATWAFIYHDIANKNFNLKTAPLVYA